jgi:hypothetical protein
VLKLSLTVKCEPNLDALYMEDRIVGSYAGGGMLEGKNFWVGVDGKGVSTGVFRVCCELTHSGLKYSSAVMTRSDSNMLSTPIPRRRSSCLGKDGRRMSGSPSMTR